MAVAVGKSVREGSALKRAAILTAARKLFLTDGFERTSMDAIAAEATVSKRTVYDYYGDKRTLLLAVVEQAMQALSSTVDAAIDEHLTTVEDLHTSLVGFATAITSSALGSADYSAFMRLLTTESTHLPELRDNQWEIAEPEDAVAARFVEFDKLGLLRAPRPRVAADHFVALTLSPSYYSLGHKVDITDAATARFIVDGVDAFLRAYGPGDEDRSR